MAPGSRRRLPLQLGAAASCLCLLAASCSVDPAQLPPSMTVVAPAPAGVPRTAVHNDAGVPTMAAPDDAARLVRLSGIPADAPAAAPSSDAHHAAAASQSLVGIFIPVFFVLGCGLFVAGLFKSADLCAAARARRGKARRVRPLGQDTVGGAAGP